MKVIVAINLSMYDRFIRSSDVACPSRAKIEFYAARLKAALLRVLLLTIAPSFEESTKRGYPLLVTE